MSDKTKALAEIGFNPKFDPNAEAAAKTGAHQRAPASANELEQRRSNKANHSERVTHGGNVGAGAKVR